MASSTLSIGSAGYDLLEALDSQTPSQLSVKKSGNSTQIRASVTGVEIDGLGFTTAQFDSQDRTGLQRTGNSTTQTNFDSSSNVNIFANVSDFNAALGGNADTLNIFGDVSGSLIQLDNKADATGNFNDILNIQGDLKTGSNGNNTIYSGGGNDTIRIAGSAEDANIFLGFGNDSLVISGNATNVDVKGDDLGAPNGNDYIEFRGDAIDTRVNAGGGGDTVIFSKGLSTDQSDLTPDTITFSDNYVPTPSTGLAAVELGSGNDSLVLGKGSYFTNATFNTGSGNDTVSIGNATVFNNVKFQLDGFHDTASNGSYNQSLIGGDKLTSATNSQFTKTDFSSNNIAGDTLVFGSGNTFIGTNFYLGQGADSLVFGTGTSFSSLFDDYSTINTGLGADTIVFGSGTSFGGNTTLNLGGDDNAQDVVRFAANGFTPNALESDIRIVGASDNDILFVGTDSYMYNTSSDSWLTNSNYTISNKA